MIVNIDDLRDAIRAVVNYNWQTEERDYEECVPESLASETYSNSREGHIFLTLRDLRSWLNEKGNQ